MNEDNDEFDAILASWKPDQPVTRHDIANLDNKVNKLIISLTQKDKDTQSLFEGVVNVDNKVNDFKDACRVVFYDIITRADNLEMKLRKNGSLSKQHAIDYVPFKELHSKKGSLYTPPYIDHRTKIYARLPAHPDRDRHKRINTTIANKYIV